MGGEIIVEFQRLFPQKVDSLIICASTPTAETEIGYSNRLKLAESIEKKGMFEYTKKHVHKYINTNETIVDSEAYKHLFGMMTGTRIKGAVASHRGRAERRINCDYLKKINIPTLVIAGGKIISLIQMMLKK